MEILNRFKRLHSDENGVALIYAAIISFLILAFCSMIWDTAKMSETKMQTQNAADAAALEMAAWQARGMNMVQALNEDIYDTDNMLGYTYGALAGLETLAKLAYIVGAGKAAEIALAVPIYAAWATHAVMVNLFMKPLRFVYANGSILIGYIAANNAAKVNGAPGIFTALLPDKSSGNILWDGVVKVLRPLFKEFTAVGIPTATGSILTLPLAAKHDKSYPLYSKNNILLKAALGILKSNSFVKVKLEPWDDEYYESKSPYDKKELPAWVWFIKGQSETGLISSYFIGGGDNVQKVPVMAYAVARVKGGNVVKYNDDKHKFRPTGCGVGADPSLVSWGKIDTIPWKLMSVICYH